MPLLQIELLKYASFVTDFRRGGLYWRGREEEKRQTREEKDNHPAISDKIVVELPCKPLVLGTLPFKLNLEGDHD